MIMRLPALLLSLVLALSGCALLNESDSPDNWSAERYFKEGKKSLDIGDYKTAIEHFENLVSRHPFGPYAQQAQLEIAYAYYKYDESESAISAADQFIKLYPRSPRVDYAYYVKGLARFPEKEFMEETFKLDFAQRDARPLRESFQYFSELIQRFPDSPYAQDSAQRMIHLRNALARNEMEAALFYMKKKAYVSAVNRAKYIIEHYDRAPSVPDALALMAEAYDNLGMPELAQDARRVLALNSSRIR